MYRQFVKNLDHFIALNEQGADDANHRLNLAKVLLPLRDRAQFEQLKEKDPDHNKALSHILWAISKNTSKYPAFETFAWELWGYGFDGARQDDALPQLEETLKIIDLLLGTSYWL